MRHAHALLRRVLTAPAAGIAAAAPCAVSTPATVGPTVLAGMRRRGLGDGDHALVVARDGMLRALALSGVRGVTVPAAGAAVAAPGAVAGLPAVWQAVLACVLPHNLSRAQVGAGGVKQPKSVHQYPAPRAPLRISHLQVHRLAAVAREVAAAVLEEGVGVRVVLREAERVAVIPAPQVNSRACASTPTAPEGDPVNVLGQEENRGRSGARALIAANREVLGPLSAEEAAVAAGWRIHPNVADLCLARARPVLRAGGADGALEGQWKIDLCRLGDPYVAEDGMPRIGTAAILVAAGGLVHPAHVCCTVAPVGDAHAHAVCQRPRKVREVAAAGGVIQQHGAHALHKPRREACEAAATGNGNAPMERRLHLKRVPRVYPVIRPWAVDAIAEVPGVQVAARPVAGVVVAHARRRVAAVGR
mmetsp:Transcript_25105/g.79187  ORF Transcript_25105/g.79187 Transcript_25105/m.79187 type:complete len:418 (+) Transcript_25105:845-2098(+)